MATDSYTVLNKTIVDTNLQNEVYQKYFWNKFTGSASLNPTTQEWKLSGNPIERFADFKLTGRNQLMITMLKNVYGYGKAGKATLVGNEKELSYLYAKLFVHLTRQGLEIPDEVDSEKIAWANIADKCKPALARWWAGFLNSEVTRAVLEGYSRDLTLATASNGLGIDKRYNKNFWFWDGTNKNFTTNEQTHSYTSGTWKNNIITGMLAADETADVFNVDLLEALAPMCSYANIEPWYLDGEEIYPLIIHSRQMATLRQSNYWSREVSNAGLRGKDNPIFKYATAKWGKFLIFVDDVVARLPYYASGTTLNFFDYSGGSEQADSVGMYEKVQLPHAGDQAIACALLLGKSCVAESIFSDLKYAKETEDYEMVKGIAASRFYGFNRLDYYDEEILVSSGTTPTAQAQPKCAVITSYVS